MLMNISRLCKRVSALTDIQVVKGEMAEWLESRTKTIVVPHSQKHPSFVALMLLLSTLWNCFDTYVYHSRYHVSTLDHQFLDRQTERQTDHSFRTFGSSLVRHDVVILSCLDTFLLFEDFGEWCAHIDWYDRNPNTMDLYTIQNSTF